MGNNPSTIPTHPGPATRAVTPASLDRAEKTREAAVTGYKSIAQLAQSYTPGAAFDGGRGHRAPLGSYLPPQAGQVQANIVRSRHGSLVPLGEWDLGQKPKSGS